LPEDLHFAAISEHNQQNAEIRAFKYLHRMNVRRYEMKQLIFIAILVFGGIAVQAQSLETEQYFDRGIRSLERSQPQEALDNFSRSLISAERSHTSPTFRAKINYNIGVSLYRLGRFEEAADRYAEAITLSNGKYKKASYALSAARDKMQTAVPRITEARAQTHPR
jgi:tetratricopeptide (TPR) repeat protein